MSEQKKGLGLKGTTAIGGDKASVQLAQKKELKASSIDDKEVEKAVGNIHSSTAKMTRLSLDVSDDMYQAIKRKQLDKRYKTTREYLLSLIVDDIQEYLGQGSK